MTWVSGSGTGSRRQPDIGRRHVLHVLVSMSQSKPTEAAVFVGNMRHPTLPPNHPLLTQNRLPEDARHDQKTSSARLEGAPIYSGCIAS